MNHARLSAALAKIGATIEQTAANSYVARLAGECVGWYVQGEAASLDAICVHMPSPHTDAQTDCFCDRHFHTIKAAVAALHEKAEKASKAAAEKEIAVEPVTRAEACKVAIAILGKARRGVEAGTRAEVAIDFAFDAVMRCAKGFASAASTASDMEYGAPIAADGQEATAAAARAIYAAAYTLSASNN